MNEIEKLCEALRSYQQADEDGVIVKVSRQACDEAATALSRLTRERDEWKDACRRAGVCMSCATSNRDPMGCTDCLNTGWYGGAPIEAQQAIAERDQWRQRESETQDALQAIGEEFGAHGGEPRTSAMRRLLTEARAENEDLRGLVKEANITLVRAFDRIHCLPRTSDTELATAIEKTRSHLTAALEKKHV